MSDEFVNNSGADQGNSYEEPKSYNRPEDYSAPEGNDYRTEQSFEQADYDQQNYNQINYTQPGYSQQNYNQMNYGQQYQQPGMVQKSETTGFGIASLILGILSIFTFFCCLNYILAIVAVILGIVQLVKSKKKGMAIGGIVTACISIIGATIFWVVISLAGASYAEEMGPFQDYLEEYMEEYMDENDAF